MNPPKPASLFASAAVVYLEISVSPACEVSMPAPALITTATIIPIARAIVDTISK